MNNNDWVAAQGQAQIPGQVNNGGEPSNAAGMDGGEWRSQLPPESRHRIVGKVMETLKRHLPYTGPDGMQELRKIALRFEEKVYSAATSQPDYLKKISEKMMSMDKKSQNPMANPLPPNAASNNTNPQDPASQNMMSQMQSQVQQLPVPMGSNQSQVHQQPLSQNIPNNMVSTGLPSSVGGMSGTMSSSVPIQNPTNLQNAGGTSMGLGVPLQRQIQGRQQQQNISQEQQQQSQNSQQYLYNQQQLQQHRMNQNLQQGNIPQSKMQQSQIQQQHKPLQTNQLQSSQQPLMQPSLRQISTASSLQSNQQSSPQKSSQVMLQQQSQSVRQQSSMPQHPMLSLQQQQQLMGHQLNTGNVQQNQLIGQQNSMLDPQQQHQQQQRVMAQQSISGLQQQQTINQQNPNMHQQQPSVQQNNHSIVHQQHVGAQTNLSGFQPGFQQQQMSGIQHGNPNLQPNQQSVSNLQNSKVPVQQQIQQNISNIMPSQPQQPQAQLAQQQSGLRQQGNPMQNRIQASGPLLQQQTTMNRQNQSLQSPSVVPDPSANPTMQSGNASGGDWQEEAYQRIKSLREMYYSELNEMYQRMAAKLQQHDALPQQPKPEQFEKLRIYKTMVERLLMFLRTSKNEITPIYREKIPGFEKQIFSIINPNRPRKPQGQFIQPQGQAMQQSQQKEPQVSQVHGSEGQINSEMQPMNMNGSAIATQQNNLTGLQQTSLSPGTGVSNARQNMMDASKPGLNADPGQGHALNQSQQVAMSSLQQHRASSLQQMNINSMPSQTALTNLQPNSYSLQANSNVIQPQQIKREQQMFPTQQVKQLYQQRQMQQQQQYFHRQQLMQQQQQQANQLQPTQFPAQKMIQQLNDTKDVKMRPQMSAKPGLHQQHHLSGQRSSYHQQPMKAGSPFSVSSQQAASPQIRHHSSPQVDLHNLLSSYKVGTPLQSANSPFIAPSPSTSIAQSPAQVDIEKLNPGMPSLSTAGNVMNQSTGTVSVPSQSLAIGTPGISASPLLAEFTSTDGTHGAASTVLSGNTSALELPIQRLINAVKALSPKALSASVNDITSVVSMVDRIAGSAPGNDSRAAVGEDLVAMTKCRVHAKNVLTQDEPGGTKKMRRYTSAIPSNVNSSTGSKNDNTRHISGNESDGESTGASSNIKRPRANNALEEELRKINQRLIDTSVCISEDDVDPTAAAAEGGGGIIVKCSFLAVALCPNLKSQYASAQMSPIQPLRLLIPNNYPNCSPIILDNFPVEVSKEYEDLSTKAKSRFSTSLKALEQPMTLAEIARTWDDSARAVITEFAQQSGGGSFSSKYGKWENCLSAA